MTDDVYYRNPADWGPPEKYQNINLTRVPLKEDATVEIRGLKAQASAENFVMLTEMFDRRIESLKGMEPIALDWKKVDDGDLITRLWIYSHEVDMDFDLMKSYSVPYLQQFKPDEAKVKSFLLGKYDKDRAMKIFAEFKASVATKNFGDRCLDLVRNIL